MPSRSQTRAVLMREGLLTLEQKILATPDLIALWALDETSGTTAVAQPTSTMNGAYTGATLAQTELRGVLYPSFDGSGDFVDIYTAALNTAFNGQLFSVELWFNPTSASLTDGLQHWLNVLSVNASNQLRIRKTATNNSFDVRYDAGGTTDSLTFTSSNTGWHQLVITVSLANDELKVYLDSAQQGTTQTGLGTWAGSLAATGCVIGAANNSGNTPWLGSLALCALYDRVLTQTEINNHYA